MKRIHGILATAASVLLTCGLAAGQNAAPAASAQISATAASKRNVNQQRQNQQDRIANGVQNGSLNANETNRLEKREARINGEIRQDKLANGGHLTQQERQQVKRQDNNLSRSIYQDKHNAATAHYGNTKVGERRENQQDRVAQGLRSGQMTPREAARTENQQRNITRQMRADRRANGGKLTAQQRRNINHKQNKANIHIYQRKHNGNHRY